MISVNNLGKRYKRYANRWARLAEWMTAGGYCGHESRWALRGVTCEVRRGETIGIIGQNGAGKSTLLKILTGTSLPSEGSFHVEGRVAALLELGMGFHPDFSGRQNAVMGCLMLGLGAGEIRQRLPDIESFAELSDYLDQPLRSYSTGMQMRLAFSVATAIRPDVLIVDEALSVGDAYFQHKCIKRIRCFSDQGTTVLLASHDPGAIKTLCARALLLERGVLIQDAKPDAVLDYYNALIAKKETDADIEQTAADSGRTRTRSGSGVAKILAVELTDAAGQSRRAFRVGEVAQFRCVAEFTAPVEQPTIGMLIRDRLGNEVFGTNTYHLDVVEPRVEASDCLAATFTTRLQLGYGQYSLSVAVHCGATHLDGNFDWWDQALAFQVIPNDSYHFVGAASLPVEVKLERHPKNNPRTQ
jgi:lipopolysaccharide transport system ATP-binding protein